MNIKVRLSVILCVLLVLIPVILPAITAGAASGPSLRTTLTDNAVQRGSKKTFDVWARNAAGEKIIATVKLNGRKIAPTWDDSEKASYTLVFTEEGQNTVTVSASSDGGKKKTLTYHISYQKAKDGEQIGTAVWSVEAFNVGCGYIIEPVEMPIYEGETSAEQLIRLLHENGLVGYYGGTVKSSFYLAYIADGTATGEKYNNYTKSGTAKKPRKLNLSPSIPSLLVPYLEDTMTFFDPDDYIKNWRGYLGEFAFTNGSGWMYCVNNVFPNVGFADSYLSDGDIVRVQFTLGYGADIDGFGAVGTEIPDADTQPESGYFPVSDKDRLTLAICRAIASGHIDRSNVRSAYNAALTVMASLNATQGAVDSAAEKLNRAVENPSSDSSSETKTDPPRETDPPATTDGSPESSDTVSTTEAPVTEPVTSDGVSTYEKTETSGSVTQPADTTGSTGTASAVITGIDDGKEEASKAGIYVIIAVIFAAVTVIAVLCLKKRRSDRTERKP